MLTITVTLGSLIIGVFAPIVIVTPPQEQYYTKVNDQVVLSCEIGPELERQSYLFEWTHNGDTVYQTVNGYVSTKLPVPRMSIVNRSSLQIDNVQPEDVGEYTCRLVEATDQKQFMFTTKLFVTGRPRCSVEFNANQRRDPMEGDQILLSCSLADSPPPVLYRWADKKGIIRDQWTPSGERSFMLSPNWDQNQLTCQIKTSDDHIIDCAITPSITVYQKTEVVDLGVHKQAVGGLEIFTLRCAATGNPLPSISWFHFPTFNMTEALNVYDTVTSKDTDRYDTVVSELTIGRLIANVTGTYRCFAYNQIGADTFDDKKDITITMISGQLETQRKIVVATPTTGRLIGAILGALFGVLVILFVALLAWWLRRRSGSSRHANPEEEMKTPLALNNGENKMHGKDAEQSSGADESKTPNGCHDNGTNDSVDKEAAHQSEAGSDSHVVDGASGKGAAMTDVETGVNDAEPVPPYSENGSATVETTSETTPVVLHTTI